MRFFSKRQTDKCVQMHVFAWEIMRMMTMMMMMIGATIRQTNNHSILVCHQANNGVQHYGIPASVHFIHFALSSSFAFEQQSMWNSILLLLT